MTPYPTLEEIHTIAKHESYDLDWEVLDSDPSACEDIEAAGKHAMRIRKSLERIYTRICGNEYPDEMREEHRLPARQEQAVAMMANALIDCYVLLDVWERFQLIRSITGDGSSGEKKLEEDWEDEWDSETGYGNH